MKRKKVTYHAISITKATTLARLSQTDVGVYVIGLRRRRRTTTTTTKMTVKMKENMTAMTGRMLTMTTTKVAGKTMKMMLSMTAT